MKRIWNERIRVGWKVKLNFIISRLTIKNVEIKVIKIILDFSWNIEKLDKEIPNYLHFHIQKDYDVFLFNDTKNWFKFKNFFFFFFLWVFFWGVFFFGFLGGELVKREWFFLKKKRGEGKKKKKFNK